MRRHQLLFGLFFLVILALTACGAKSFPLAPQGTLLSKIQDRGKLIVGVKYDLPTIGYLNPSTKVVEGFEPAIAREIAAYIFGDPSKVEFKESVTQDRLPFLNNGTVDIVIATFTINADRLKQMDFSNVYLTSNTRLMVRGSSSIKGISDLAGKRVAVNKGSTTSDVIMKAGQGLQVLLVTNTFDGVQAVAKGQADAVAGDDTALYGMALTNPGMALVGSSLAPAPLGVGIAKGHPEMVTVVNTVIRNLKTAGKWKEIWKREIGDKVGISTIPDPPDDAWTSAGN